MKRFLIIGALLTWLALGPVQDAIQAGNNPFAEFAGALNQTQQWSVDAYCAAMWDSTVDPDCGIELRSPAELAAQAGRG